jgi:hypothetical protein
MNEEQEDFAIKLTMIEQQAKLVLDDMPPGTMRDRIQHIATTAKLLRQRLNVASTLILPTHAPKQR